VFRRRLALHVGEVTESVKRHQRKSEKKKIESRAKRKHHQSNREKEWQRRARKICENKKRRILRRLSSASAARRERIGDHRVACGVIAGLTGGAISLGIVRNRIAAHPHPWLISHPASGRRRHRFEEDVAGGGNHRRLHHGYGVLAACCSAARVAHQLKEGKPKGGENSMIAQKAAKKSKNGACKNSA